MTLSNTINYKKCFHLKLGLCKLCLFFTHGSILQSHLWSSWSLCWSNKDSYWKLPLFSASLPLLHPLSHCIDAGTTLRKSQIILGNAKTEGDPTSNIQAKIAMAVHKALQKEKDVVWQCKEVIKPQSCQSFCVFRWVPAAYSTFVSLSLFFFWKLLILIKKRMCLKTFFIFFL